MSIDYQILGQPGQDNALFVRIDSGQSIDRLLFDCGEGCLHALSFSEIQAIDHLFFSHLHMDHVGGFDTFFRCNYGRTAKRNEIWGPPGTAQILHHRFQGYWWNLYHDLQASWFVNDVSPGHVNRFRYELSEAFAVGHKLGSRDWNRIVLEEETYTVEAIQLQHHGPCLGWIMREASRVNVDMQQLGKLGLRPGPWMKQLKESTEPETVQINGHPYDLRALQQQLLVETPGDSMAYLTDFRLDEQNEGQLATAVSGVTTLVCESQYRHADLELARKNDHTTTVLVSRLAARANVGQLVLFHLSDRYQQTEWLEMLDEARAIFPATSFPDFWQFGEALC